MKYSCLNGLTVFETPCRTPTAPAENGFISAYNNGYGISTSGAPEHGSRNSFILGLVFDVQRYCTEWKFLFDSLKIHYCPRRRSRMGTYRWLPSVRPCVRPSVRSSGEVSEHSKENAWKELGDGSKCGMLMYPDYLQNDSILASVGPVSTLL